MEILCGAHELLFEAVDDGAAVSGGVDGGGRRAERLVAVLHHPSVQHFHLVMQGGQVVLDDVGQLVDLAGEIVEQGTLLRN